MCKQDKLEKKSHPQRDIKNSQSASCVFVVKRSTSNLKKDKVDLGENDFVNALVFSLF